MFSSPENNHVILKFYISGDDWCDPASMFQMPYHAFHIRETRTCIFNLNFNYPNFCDIERTWTWQEILTNKQRNKTKNLAQQKMNVPFS